MSYLNKILLSAFCFVCALCIMMGSVFGWLYAGNKLNIVNVTGKSPSSYFSSGDGSSENPYKISSPVHLYNLAWLQYIGYFYTASNVSIQSYFKLENNIDMSGYILPPIGTTEYPFIGNFDGNSCTISNLTVCNSTGSGGINNIPSAGFTDTKAEIIGLFGVVGDYNDALKKYTYDSSVISVSNLYLNNITIRVQTANALVGIIAGYVNGNVSSVGVLNARIAIDGSSKTKINKIAAFNKFSRSSLIGEWADGVSWSGMPTSSETEGNDGEGETSPDGGTNFGGSLDMYTLNRRLTYMFGSSGSYVAGQNYVYNFMNANQDIVTPKYNAYLRAYCSSASSYFYATSSSVTNVSSYRSTMYIHGGSYFPLNVNTSIMFNEETTNGTVNGAYTLYSTKYYDANSSESVKDTNTGYIVTTKTTTAGTSGAVATAIISSLKDMVGSVEIESGTISSLKLFGRNANGTYVIGEPKKDDSGNLVYNNGILTYNNLTANSDGQYTIVEKTAGVYNVARNKYQLITNIVSSSDISNYNSIKSQLVNSFGGVSGSLYCYGFRFENQPSQTTYFTAGSVSLSGNTYTNYEFLQSAVNFHLESSGVITAVVANISYSGEKKYRQMFNLYKIKRSSSDTTKISSVELLEKDVYGGTSYNASWYTVDSDAESDSSKYIGLNGYSMYLIQIPVEAGDYALGGANGAYFLYLDVGASGNSSETTPDTGDGGSDTETQDALIIKNVGFINSVASVDWDTYKVVIVSISLTDLSEAAYVYFLRNSNTEMYYYCDVASLKFTGLVDDGLTLSVNSAAVTPWSSAS